MNTNLLNIINRIVAEQGEGILSEPRRITAFFADLAKDEQKSQKNAFIKCLEHGFAQALKNVSEPDRDACKRQLAQKLHDEEGLDLGLCGEALELLAAVLFANEKKKAYCKNCGKELQEEWKTCPYCSTPVANNVCSKCGKELQEGWSSCPYCSTEDAANAEAQVPITQGDESNIENTQLKRQLTQVDEVNIENTQLKKKLKKIKYGLIAAIVLGIICTVIFIILLSDKSKQYDYKIKQYDELSSKYNLLSSENYKIRNLLNIEITSIKAGNSDKDNNWFTKPGERLSSAKMRYLSPVIYYNSNVSGNVTFYVKIISPYGTLFNNPSISPSGYSYSTTVQINSGSNESLEIGGWGNATESTYSAGTWTVEVWYNNVCLKSERIVIGQ